MSNPRTNSNYGGRQGTPDSYTKTFFYGNPIITWTYLQNSQLNNKKRVILAPTNKNSDVYIYNDLIVQGFIFNPSDIKLKDNIEDLNLSFNEKILNLNPKQYTYKSDENQNIHYGFIAQELEEQFPHLVKEVNGFDDNDEKIKTVNYLEMIPILLLKIKDMQSQIDELKKNVSYK